MTEHKYKLEYNDRTKKKLYRYGNC